MKILIIDNYDSFTYNLYQYVGDILELSGTTNKINVIRNNSITTNQIKKNKYDRIIISPGPGNPADAAYFGVCADVLLTIGKTIPVLGVCLGMQGIAHYFGGRIIKAHIPMHGKTSLVSHSGRGVFKNIPNPITVMRYHSLAADQNTIPDCLEITATTDDKFKEIMGLRHKKYPIEGVQFHPESFATEAGKELLQNFLIQ